MNERMREMGEKSLAAVEKTRNRSPLGLASGTREKLLIIFSAAGVSSLLGLALWFCRYGIDFIDESFYLVWISNPFLYTVSAVPTQFGFIYHPLHDLLRGDIAALRQANILITFILAWVVTHIILATPLSLHARSFIPYSVKPGPRRYVLSAGFATVSLSSMVFQGMWLPTPSYNTLAFQALLIAAAGMLLAGQSISKKTMSGWVMIGIGGWLSFMAKPTTAAALALVVLVYLIGTGKFRFRLLLVSAAVASGLLVLSAVIIDGSVIRFIARLRTSLDLMRSIESGHSFTQSLMGLVNFPIHSARSVLLYSAILLILIAAYKSRFGFLKIVAFSSLSAVIAIIVFRITSGGRIGGAGTQFFLRTVFEFFLMLGVPFMIVCFSCINRCKGLVGMTIPRWIAVLCFFALPLVYSFGSNQDYWYQGCSAGFFWMLSALIMLVIISGARFETILPFSAATTIMMAAVLLSGLVSPFRQPQPLWRNHHPVEIHGSTLVLDPSSAAYIEKAHNAAHNAGFVKGTPIIDLSGISPGLIYAINGLNIGQAWILGGLPGSDRVAIAALEKVHAEQIAASWLLVEPHGYMRISSTVLSSFGADILRDYEVVASWTTPSDGFGGARFQELLRPTRSLADAVAACHGTRTKSE